LEIRKWTILVNTDSKPLFFIHLEGRGLFLWKRGMYLNFFDVYIFKELEPPWQGPQPQFRFWVQFSKSLIKLITI
jgi:hypothetical protein